MNAEMDRRARARSRRPPAPRPVIVVDPTTVFAGLAVVLLFLFAALIWAIHLEATLPDIRLPRADGASVLLPDKRLASPGQHSVAEIDMELTGSWITQELGDAMWQATADPGSRVRLAFYGTEVSLIARLGPEAGVAYVLVNGSPPAHLPLALQGAVVDLRASQAADRRVLLATDLAHGEHVLEIISGGEGELALSGFVISAQTPFPWVFVLAYSGLLAGLFIVTRALVYMFTTSRDEESGPSQAENSVR
jgi:hypothetical protein